MNVWIDMGKGPRPKNHKPKNTTKAPRTREGKTYPGGRFLRRALKSLAARQAAYEASKTSVKGKAANSFTKPGSMTK